MSKDGARPRSVQFVDVTAREKNTPPPAWLVGRSADTAPGTADYPVAPLRPPEVPTHARPPLAPLLESARPPTRPPSQLPPALGGLSASGVSVALSPGALAPPGLPRMTPASLAPPGFPSQAPPPRPPSQFPPGAAASQFPGAPSQFPGAATPSQFPGPAEGAHDPGLPAPGRDRRRDTLVEDLVPRAEEEAVTAIKAAVEQFAQERAQMLEQAEQELIELVKVICRRVVLREVSLSSSVVEALVQEGLSSLGRGDKVAVKLGPFFADALDHISDNLRQRGIACTVTIDPGVGTHGCVLETALGRVDESVETRLGVLLQSLDTVP